MPVSWEHLLNKFCGWSEKQDARDAEAQALEAGLEALKTLPAPTASSSSSSLQPPQPAASTSSSSTLSPPQRTVDSIDEASRDFRLGHAKLSGMHELHFDDPATGKAVRLSICRTEADMQEVARALGVEEINRRRRKSGLRRQWPDIEVLFLTVGGGCFNYDNSKAGRTSHTSQEKDFGLRFFSPLGQLVAPPHRPQPISGGKIESKTRSPSLSAQSSTSATASSHNLSKQSTTGRSVSCPFPATSSGRIGATTNAPSTKSS